MFSHTRLSAIMNDAVDIDRCFLAQLRNSGHKRSIIQVLITAICNETFCAGTFLDALDFEDDLLEHFIWAAPIMLDMPSKLYRHAMEILRFIKSDFLISENIQAVVPQAIIRDAVTLYPFNRTCTFEYAFIKENWPEHIAYRGITDDPQDAVNLALATYKRGIPLVDAIFSAHDGNWENPMMVVFR